MTSKVREKTDDLNFTGLSISLLSKRINAPFTIINLLSLLIVYFIYIIQFLNVDKTTLCFL